MIRNSMRWSSIEDALFIDSPEHQGQFPNQIESLPKGSTFYVRRVYVVPPIIYGYDIQTGQYRNFHVTKAWFTVKQDPDGDDTTAALQKIITTTEDSNGLIFGQGTGTFSSQGLVSMIFYLNSSDTTNMVPDLEYFYDIQCLSENGVVFPAEVGTIDFVRTVTTAKS